MKGSQVGNLNELNARVQEWDDFTPAGINELDKVIRSYRLGPEEKAYNRIIDVISNNTKQYINARVPNAISRMNADYAQAADELDKLRQAIGSDRTPDQTKINRLVSLFKPISRYRKELVESMGREAANDLIDQLYAYALSEMWPIGSVRKIVEATVGAASLTQGVGAAASMIPAVAATSPRIGAGVTALGAKAAPAVMRGIEAVTPVISGQVSK